MAKTPNTLKMNTPKVNTLSPPAVRQAAHRRTITLDGYARDDGAYDIEAELIDTKAHSFPSRAHGEIKKGQPLHHMRVRVTVTEEMEIIAAEAVTIAGPYHECPQGAHAIANLVGETIRPGWKKITARAIGGVQGCTHITELMGPVATVAFQTIYGERAKRARQDAAQNPEANAAPQIASPQISGLLNSCHALAEGRQAAFWNWGIPLQDEAE